MQLKTVFPNNRNLRDDVTVSIFYSTRNGNDGTITLCGNDAQLWSLAYPVPEFKDHFAGS
jgi:hypothetical protein